MLSLYVPKLKIQMEEKKTILLLLFTWTKGETLVQDSFVFVFTNQLFNQTDSFLFSMSISALLQHCIWLTLSSWVLASKATSLLCLFVSWKIQAIV
jgi:hypothetical protein